MYTQNQPHYDAAQWVDGGDVQAFATKVDPGLSLTWSVNDDGSLRAIIPDAGVEVDVPVDAWLVTPPTWGQPFWAGLVWLGSPSGNGYFTDAEFQAEFTLES